MFLLRNRQGFTLIELALVTLIIGTLALMAAPMVMQKNRSQSVNGFAEELNWSLEVIRRYFVMNGNFPTSWNDLITSGALPRAPVDPFGGTVTLITDNTGDPKTCTIHIQGGVAGTEYGNIIVRRVPYAVQDINNQTIDITLNEFMNWLFKEIVYVGIHRHNDLVPKQQCIGFPNRYVVTDFVALQGTEDSPVYQIRTWAADYDVNNYQVYCEVYDGANTTATHDCLIKVMQICH